MISGVGVDLASGRTAQPPLCHTIRPRVRVPVVQPARDMTRPPACGLRPIPLSRNIKTDDKYPEIDYAIYNTGTTESSEAMVHIALINLMSKRLDTK